MISINGYTGVWDVPKGEHHWELIEPFVNVPYFVQKLPCNHLYIGLILDQTSVGAWGPMASAIYKDFGEEGLWIRITPPSPMQVTL